MCQCKPNYDLRCICDPRDEDFALCPERHRYIYEGIICNEKRVYDAIFHYVTMKDVVAWYFRCKGLDLPNNINYAQLQEWWNEELESRLD